jgi:hypothetical protein
VDSAPPPPTSRRALILAIVAYFIVKTIIPFGRLFTYPLTLLATWVHESGHGFTSLLVGGHFDHLDVYADASGLAFTSSAHAWQQGLTSAGGLMAPPIVGALLLGVSRGPRRARIALAVMAAAIVVSLIVWVRSVAGWIALPLDVAVLVYFAARGTTRGRMVFAQFIGVALAMDTVSRVDYLFSSQAVVDGVPRPSDIVSVATAFGGQYLLWGLGLALLSAGLLAVGLYTAWRDPAKVKAPSARGGAAGRDPLPRRRG